MQGAENKSNNLRAKEQQQNMEEEGKPLPQRNVTMVSSSVTETQKLQQVTRTRSSRLSRDLDFNPETLLMNTSPTSSYTALLLEDIQNFHQKGAPVIPCLTKANSILEAVADLNSTTISNRSNAEQFVKKKRLETKEPFVESEVIGSDDLMEPSFQKYVTVSRGGGVGGGGDTEEVESSGSNSFIGGGQSWVSSSMWETNSADSTDKWSSLRSEQKRESDRKPNGIGRRLVSGRGLQATPQALKAASS